MFQGVGWSAVAFACLALAARGTVACSSDDEAKSPTPTPDAAASDVVAPRDGGPTAPSPGVIAWGHVALLYRHGCDNTRMLKNALQALARKEKDIKVLYTEDDNCDPRQGVSTCGIAELDKMKPFFDLIGELGTIDFHRATTDLSAYDVVIADFCNGEQYIAQNEEALRTFMDTRGGIFVAGSFWCANGSVENSSARAASAFTKRYGIEFNNDRGKESEGCGPVVVSGETTLAGGVGQLDLFHLGTLTVSGEARGILGASTSSNPYAAVYERVLR